MHAGVSLEWGDGRRSSAGERESHTGDRGQQGSVQTPIAWFAENLPVQVEYVECFAEFRLQGSVQAELEAFREGFWKVRTTMNS